MSADIDLVLVNQLTVTAFLQGRGWTESGSWWLPPIGRHLRSKCYRKMQAYMAEVEAERQPAPPKYFGGTDTPEPNGLTVGFPSQTYR